MQANEQRVSAPMTLRELYGGARCLPCRQQDRRCHVEYNADQCVQCAREDVCIFERTVQRTGPYFSWNELIGDAEVVGTLDTGRSGRAALPKPPSPWRPPRELLNDSSATHRPSGVDTFERTGSMGLHYDRPLDRTSVIRGSSYRGTAGHSYTSADPYATMRVVPPNLPQYFFSYQTTREHRDNIVHEKPQTIANYLSDPESDEGRASFGLFRTSQHSRTDPKAGGPYVCHIPLCPQGFKSFSSLSDLQRHQKSAHGIQPNRPSATRDYKCFGTNCPRRDKVWPRLDNFKQHLIRMHKDEDTDDLIAK